jgi:multidrug efflux pump
VELNPTWLLNKYGIGLEQVRTRAAGANANTPKGHFSDNHRAGKWAPTIRSSRPSTTAAGDRLPQRIGGARLRCRQAVDSVEDLRKAGYANGKPSVLVIIFRQPGANIIDRRGSHPRRAAAAGIHSARHQRAGGHGSDRHHPRLGHDVERTLLISVLLVILVVFFFCGTCDTFIPSVAVPVSLIGTFGVMYLLATASTISR